MKIAVIGAGNVGAPLAGRLSESNHEVVLGGPDPASDSIRRAKDRWPGLKAASTPAAVADSEVVLLAVPFGAAADVIREAGPWSGKVIVDCTNPVGPGLSHGLDSQRSGAESIQEEAHGASVVKAFTIYGYENLEDSQYPGYGDLRPAMLIAGDEAKAKARVASLCEVLGFEPVDTGPLSCALHLEHMTLLWIKMARVQGQGAGLVWARLTRD